MHVSQKVQDCMVKGFQGYIFVPDTFKHLISAFVFLRLSNIIRHVHIIRCHTL